MGRKRRKQVEHIEHTRDLNPYPSSPTKPPTHVVYCFRGDEAPRKIVVFCYRAAYAAQALCEAMLEEGECEFIAPDRVRGENGVELKSDKLKEILYHRKTLAEMGWSLSEKEQREVSQFLNGPIQSDYVPHEQKPRGETGGRATARMGFTSIGDLAEELDMKPREARGILRGAGEKKPQAGWTWANGSNELERIKKLLGDNR